MSQEIMDGVGPSTGVSRIPSAAADTNATLVKSKPGVVTRVNGYNAAAAVRYLKFYDKATAPTVGTDTPVLTIALPASSRFDVQVNHRFTVGIGFGMVTGAADNSSAALTAADVLGLNVQYK